MLKVIGMLDAGTVRGLIVATVPLLVLIASFFGVDEAVFKANLEGWGEKAVALVSLAGVAWAAYARVFKPTPPVTETAAKATQERLQKEGGFAKAGMLAVLLGLSGALVAVAGCQALGLEPANTFNKRLASGYTTVTAISQATGIWLDGQVQAAQAEPPDRRQALLAALRKDAQNILDTARQAKDGLDVAASLRGVDLKAAELRLASTLRILQSLQSYLEGK